MGFMDNAAKMTEYASALEKFDPRLCFVAIPKQFAPLRVSAAMLVGQEIKPSAPIAIA